MNPRSIAVLGASARAEAMGNTVIKNLQRLAYGGKIFPVHPTATEVLGLKCYPTLAALPDKVDCVVIALSADKTFAALQEMAAIGARSAVLYASGFAETGEAGAALQEEMREFCLKNDINLCGPNCLGIYSVQNGVALYSAAVPDNMQPGELALVSHSGSACIVMSSLNRFRFSHLVSLGNGAVTDIPEYLDFISQDGATSVAALFVETLRDPEAFAKAAAKMHAAGKPIVALKVARSASGAAASAAHTGAIASSDVALQAFFRRHGVILVEDYDELAEVCSLLLTVKCLPEGRGVGVLNVSGGELALTCDIAERIGMELPELNDATLSHLRTVLPAFGSPRNPLDATGVGVFDTKMYGDCLEGLANDPRIHVLAVSQDCPASLGQDQAAIYRKLAETVAERSAALKKPVVFFNNVAGSIHPEVLAPLRSAFVPALQGMRNALGALQRLIDYAAWRREAQVAATSNLEDVRKEHWVARLRQAAPLTEREGKDFLRDHGISVTQEELANSEADALAAAHRIGYPIVLKIESVDLPHKSEVGGVEVNVTSDAECRSAYRKILDNVREKAPKAEVGGVLVQQMVGGGVEAILGVVTHRPFGPGVVVGSGGVLVELVKDASFELAPVDADHARQMVERTRLATLLGGFRGAPVADRGALEAMVLRLSQVAEAYADELEAIDLNPVSILPKGSGAVVLDALVIQRKHH